MAEQFATLIAEVRVEDADLKIGLGRSEKLVRESAARMERSLGLVSTASSKVGTASFDAAKGLSAFSSSAGALGGQLGGVIGQVAAGIQSLGDLTSSLGGLAGALGLGAAVVGAGLLVSKIVTLRSETALLALEFEQAMRAANQLFETSENKAAQSIVDDSKSRAALLRQQAAVRDDPAAAKEASTNARLRVLAERERRIGLEQNEQGRENANRRLRQLAAIDEERSAIRLNRTSEIKAKNAADDKKFQEAKTKELQRQAALTEAAVKASERIRSIQAATTRGAAQALAIQTGINKPSDFVDDPGLKRLLQLGERFTASLATQSGGFSGTIGSRAAGNLSAKNLSLNPQFGAQKVSSEKEQTKQTALLKEIKTALGLLNLGAV